MNPMDHRLDRLQETVASIRETQGKMMAMVERNSQDLAEHMRRTEINEKRLEEIENKAHEWKGFLLAVSTLFGIISAISHMLVSVYFRH